MNFALLFSLLHVSFLFPPFLSHFPPYHIPPTQMSFGKIFSSSAEGKSAGGGGVIFQLSISVANSKVNIARIFIIDGHICWNSESRLPFIVCRPRKPSSVSVCRKQMEVCHFCFVCSKQTEAAIFCWFRIPYKYTVYTHIYIEAAAFVYLYLYYLSIYIYIYNCIYMLPFQMEKETQAIFLDPFTFCSS